MEMVFYDIKTLMIGAPFVAGRPADEKCHDNDGHHDHRDHDGLFLDALFGLDECLLDLSSLGFDISSFHYQRVALQTTIPAAPAATSAEVSSARAVHNPPSGNTSIRNRIPAVAKRITPREISIPAPTLRPATLPSRLAGSRVSWRRYSFDSSTSSAASWGNSFTLLMSRLSRSRLHEATTAALWIMVAAVPE